MLFLDSHGAVWAVCGPDDAGAVAFGPRGTARPRPMPRVAPNNPVPNGLALVECADGWSLLLPSGVVTALWVAENEGQLYRDYGKNVSAKKAAVMVWRSLAGAAQPSKAAPDIEPVAAIGETPGDAARLAAAFRSLADALEGRGSKPLPCSDGNIPAVRLSGMLVDMTCEDDDARDAALTFARVVLDVAIGLDAVEVLAAYGLLDE